MRNTLTLAAAALAIALPSLAFAQASTNAPTSVPSAEQPKTPAVGTSEGRSSATGAGMGAQSDMDKPNTDGMHPSGDALDSKSQTGTH